MLQHRRRTKARAIAHHARGQERFFCYGNVTSSRRDDVDLPLPVISRLRSMVITPESA